MVETAVAVCESVGEDKTYLGGVVDIDGGEVNQILLGGEAAVLLLKLLIHLLAIIAGSNSAVTLPSLTELSPEEAPIKCNTFP